MKNQNAMIVSGGICLLGLWLLSTPNGRRLAVQKADGKFQAKYFGKVRDEIQPAECTVSQLKVKADDNEPTAS